MEYDIKQLLIKLPITLAEAEDLARKIDIMYRTAIKASKPEDLIEEVRELLDCPYTLDKVSIPEAGIEVATEQVVGVLSVSLARKRRVEKTLSDWEHNMQEKDLIE